MNESNESRCIGGVGREAGSLSGAQMARGSAIGHGCAMQPEQVIEATVEVRATRNFADALMHAMSGKHATRAGWNGAGQFIKAMSPGIGCAPYMALKNTQGQLVPWAPSQGDLFANDWALLP